MAEGGWPSGRFNEVLRTYRASASLSQEELARRSGLSVRAISDMERGRTIKPFGRSVRQLAEALELDAHARARLIAAANEGTGEAEPSSLGSGGTDARPWPAVPRQPPTAVQHFVGRSAELRRLYGLLDQMIAGRAPVTSVIHGTAGVGKTALVLYWAHQVADHFPDGQLYVNLRGFDPTEVPTAANEAIRAFLDALGVPPEQIPVGLDAQAALYRSVLANRRMLIVADNASNERQVRPLLPGAGANMVVVTSRSQLDGLVAIEGAERIFLDILTTDEAWQFLTGRLGAARLAAERRSATDLIGLCANLPLALAIAGTRAAFRPATSLATLADELRESHRRLDAFEDTDSRASIRAVFSWSYRNLPAPAARMFRLLSLHPGPDISVHAAASLAAATVAQARSLLRELKRCHLLAEPRPDRFAFHDLLRAYSAEQAELLESGADRAAARTRLFDHHLHTAYGAALLLSPSHAPISLSPPAAGVQPEQLNGFHQAMDWFTAEHQTLIALVQGAAAIGCNTYGWQLPWVVETFLDWQGHWSDLAATQHTALAAAERLGDLAGQAHVHRNIGHATFWLGSYEDASTHLSRALELYRQLGDHVSQARVHLDQARVHNVTGRYREALEHSRRGLTLFREEGHQLGEAHALNAVGWCHAHLGDHCRALDYCKEALDLARGMSDQMLLVVIWDSIGYIRHQLGQHEDAISCYQNALTLCRDLGNYVIQAEALIHIGDTWLSTGDRGAARAAWQEALNIFNDLGHQDAVQIHVRLSSLNA